MYTRLLAVVSTLCLLGFFSVAVYVAESDHTRGVLRNLKSNLKSFKAAKAIFAAPTPTPTPPNATLQSNLESFKAVEVDGAAPPPTPPPTPHPPPHPMLGSKKSKKYKGFRRGGGASRRGNGELMSAAYCFYGAYFASLMRAFLWPKTHRAARAVFKRGARRTDEESQLYYLDNSRAPWCSSFQELPV